MSNLLLTDLVLSLKQQLSELYARDKEDNEVLLSLTEVELEVVVEATASTNTKGGVAFWVISGERAAGASERNLQRLKLRLTPPAPLILGS